MFNKKNLIFCFIIFFELKANKVNLVTFSYDRPLQLYAFLESVQKNIINLNKITVIYRTSQNKFSSAYQIVKNKFKNVEFIKQSIDNPEQEFKKLVVNLAFGNNSSEFIVFAVDDIVVKQKINIDICTHSLKKTNCYGFYLRLGNNITQCFMHNDEFTPVPKHAGIFKCDDEYLFSWNFNDGSGDWKYPNTLDMTIYKKEDIKDGIMSCDFKNPSELEAIWAAKANYNKIGLCFYESKIVNLPMNIVHNEKLNINNRNASIFTTDELLDIFNCNLKLDINIFNEIKNTAPHAVILPKFIKRDF